MFNYQKLLGCHFSYLLFLKILTHDKLVFVWFAIFLGDFFLCGNPVLNCWIDPTERFYFGFAWSVNSLGSIFCIFVNFLTWDCSMM